MATQINYGIKSISRLDEPYGTCMSSRNHVIENVIRHEEDMMYTSKLCIAQCLGSRIMKECGCIDVGTSHSLYLDQQYPEYPYCHSASHSRREFISYAQCADKFRTLRATYCVEHCVSPCNENQYVSKVSTIQWPRATLIPSFHDKVIKEKPYAHKFSDLEKDCTSDSNCTILDHLKQRKLIDDHFAKVSIILGDNMHAKLEDNVKTSAFSFMAQLGGALNLWNAITLVIIIEVLECILKLGMFTKVWHPERPEECEEAQTKAQVDAKSGTIV